MGTIRISWRIARRNSKKFTTSSSTIFQLKCCSKKKVPANNCSWRLKARSCYSSTLWWPATWKWMFTYSSTRRSRKWSSSSGRTPWSHKFQSDSRGPSGYRQSKTLLPVPSQSISLSFSAVSIRSHTGSAFVPIAKWTKIHLKNKKEIEKSWRARYGMAIYQAFNVSSRIHQRRLRSWSKWPKMQGLMPSWTTRKAFNRLIAGLIVGSSRLSKNLTVTRPSLSLVRRSISRYEGFKNILSCWIKEEEEVGNKQPPRCRE